MTASTEECDNGRRRLIVLRHAKSSWRDESLHDHARPLNARGRRDAPRIARAIVEAGWAPDLVLSSDSTRTTETWALMGSILGGQVRFLPDLYLASAAGMLRILAAQGDSHHTVALLAHNPGCETLVAGLSDTDHRFTTCNAALLEARVDGWQETGKTSWELVALIRPRDLPR